MNGTIVIKCPKFLSALPAKDDHALLVHNLDSCSPPLTIMMSLDGVTNYFKARHPCLAEYEDKNISQYHLMSERPLWDPSTSLHSLQEDSMVDYRGNLIVKLSMDTHSPDMVMGSVV